MKIYREILGIIRESEYLNLLGNLLNDLFSNFIQKYIFSFFSNFIIHLQSIAFLSILKVQHKSK